MTDSVESVLQKLTLDFHARECLCEEDECDCAAIDDGKPCEECGDELDELKAVMRSALEPMLAELKAKITALESCRVNAHLEKLEDCRVVAELRGSVEAAEQALREAHQTIPALVSETIHSMFLVDKIQQRVTEVLQQALSPSPTPAQDKSRCSVCGCSRVVVTRERPVKYGACSFIECADPLKDYRAEDALLAKPSPESATPAQEPSFPENQRSLTPAEARNLRQFYVELDDSARNK